MFRHVQLKNQVHETSKIYLEDVKKGYPDHLQVDFHKKTYITGKDENAGLVVFYDVVSRVSWFGCQNGIRLLHSRSVVRFPAWPMFPQQLQKCKEVLYFWLVFFERIGV